MIKQGYRDGLERGDAIDLAISALFYAADDDSATGGPDLIRGIYPVIATITAQGFRRVDDAEIAERFAGLVATLTGRESGASRLPETSTETGGSLR